MINEHTVSNSLAKYDGSTDSLGDLNHDQNDQNVDNCDNKGWTSNKNVTY